MLKMEEEEVEAEASESGSGCESGWTTYLDHSHESSASLLHHGGIQEEEEEDEEEEEGLSMVSDASSGPPHDDDDDDDYPHLVEKKGRFASASSPSPIAPGLQHKSGKRRRVEAQRQTASSYLDDTASSPFLGFPRNTSCHIPSSNACSRGNKVLVEEALEFSCDFSATYLKGKSTMQKPLHYTESISAKPIRSGEVGKKIW